MASLRSPPHRAEPSNLFKANNRVCDPYSSVEALLFFDATLCFVTNELAAGTARNSENCHKSDGQPAEFACHFAMINQYRIAGPCAAAHWLLQRDDAAGRCRTPAAPRNSFLPAPFAAQEPMPAARRTTPEQRFALNRYRHSCSEIRAVRPWHGRRRCADRPGRGWPGPLSASRNRVRGRRSIR